MKKILAMLLALVMVFGLVACGNADTDKPVEPSNQVQDTTEDQTDVVVGAGETEAEKGTPVDRQYEYGTLVLGTTEAGGGFDRVGTHGNQSSLLCLQNVWDSLFIINSDTLEVEPLMVKEYEWVDDTTLHIVLHEGIVSESGEPITAEDVIYSAERFVAEKSRMGTYYVAYDFERMWAELSDPDTLDFNWYYKYPYGPGLSYLTFAVFPKDWATEGAGAEDAAWWDAPDATGPYTCVENVDGSHVSFQLRDSYYGDTTGYPTSATIKYYTEQTALYTDYSTGAIDAAFGLASGDVQNLMNGQLPHTAYKIAAKNDVYAMTLCHYTEYFQDQNVRLAIAHAIDAEGVTAAAFGVLGKAATSVLPAGVNYYVNVGQYEYNVELAKEYLAKSPWPNGFDCMTVCTNDAPTVAIATAVQGYLSQIGINLSFEAYGVPIAVGEWMVPGKVDLGFKNCMEGSPSLDPDQIFNTIGYDTTNASAAISKDPNDAFNTALTATLQHIDPAIRQENYTFIQEYLKETAIQIPLVEAFYGYCYRNDYITDFNVTSPSTPHLRYCHIVDEATYNGQ